MTKTLKRDINTKKFLLAISPELYAKLKMISVKNNRTVQGQIRTILEGVVAVWEKKYGSEPAEEEPPDGGVLTAEMDVLHERAVFPGKRGYEAIRLL